jgi:hypothetical protein
MTMTSKRLISIVLLCFIAVCFVSVFTQPAFAQDDLMQKKGIGGLFQGKGVKEGDPRLPNQYQKWAGWGSILVMIIVVKYL